MTGQGFVLHHIPSGYRQAASAATAPSAVAVVTCRMDLVRQSPATNTPGMAASGRQLSPRVIPHSEFRIPHLQLIGLRSTNYNPYPKKAESRASSRFFVGFHYASSASSQMETTISSKEIPAARAESGSRLISVMPGMVLTSTTMGPRSLSTMKSTRDTPRQERSL